MSQSNVLVVSPFEEDHALVRRVFPEPAWVLFSATTGEQALELAGLHRMHIVIVERYLTDRSWKTLWEELREAAGRPQLIVTSRHADNRLWAEVLNLGGYDVLAKPLDELEVAEVVRSASRRRQAERVVEQA
jgi:DNA-binding response OmpR family regulator